MDPREKAIRDDEASRFSGNIGVRKASKLPRRAGVYFFTSAQNNTRVHVGFWRNLQAYAAARRGQIFVSQFTYNKSKYGEKSIKPGSGNASDYESLWYAPEILPHVCNDRLQITKSLAFCGEINIIPTASRPLSGFENYTGRSSGIYPHVKQEMESIASTSAAKFNYSTGAVTLRNYVQKKAGLKAEYQHAYGALIVEVDSDGDWFVRQIRATEDGSFQDLGYITKDGKVTGGHRILALQPGDVHVEQIDPMVKALIWGVGGSGGMIDELMPEYQFLHDTLDMHARNHHEIKNVHAMFERFVHGRDDVQAELRRVADFLKHTSARPFCKTIVVDSNHDQALMRWAKEADFTTDPVNARFYLQLQHKIFESLYHGTEMHLLEAVMRQMKVPRSVRFLRTDESFVICKKAGGIECGMHGHLGLNGARGSPRAFTRIGRRANTGHTHSAGIAGDVFTAGTSTKLRLPYNKGPSSWSQTVLITYANGCRSLVTVWKGKWCMDQRLSRSAA